MTMPSFFSPPKKQQLTLASAWENIILGHLQIQSPRELFIHRLAAFSHLGDENKTNSDKAKQFILSTMQQTEAEYNLPEKIKFIQSVRHWSEPKIIADDALNNTVEYQIVCQLINKSSCILHEKSYFKFTQDGAWRYVYKESYPSPQLRAKL
ncbi:MAG: hypothetical protein KIT27_08065 [Legionellales bacterium]|nr:hypothetical protein [Legionellales bacterium]